MTNSCVVPGCNSQGNELTHSRIFFCFPKNAKIAEKWEKSIPRKGFRRNRSSKVCEIHFTDDCFIRDSQCAGSRKDVKLARDKAKLIPDAIPTIFLHGPSSKTDAKRQKISHVDSVEKLFDDSKTEDSPEAVFQSLIEPVKLNEFLSQYWEKKPLIIKGKKTKSFILNWFSKAKVLELLEEHDLQFLLDLHFCVCVKGRTKDLNKGGKVTPAEFHRLTDKLSATAQIHQVQRFVDPLWQIMEKLESFFGSLVGSNVYVTPQGSQGLAPHYDDVEVFIFQLEGEKHWRLYAPPVELAREYKTNLPSEVIGEPTHEFILKPGDVLYMPRGTVHQADTPVGAPSHSTHITISMYQKHSVGDFLEHGFSSLIENGYQDCLALRTGLPIGLFQMNKNSDVTQLVIKSLEFLAKSLKGSCLSPPRHMIEDFMRNRLPPFCFNPEILEEGPSGSKPTLTSKVLLTYPKHVSFLLANQDDYIEDDDSDISGDVPPNEEPVLIVYSSIGNSRLSHMIKVKSEDEENFDESNHFIKLKFPANCKSALEELLSASSPLEVQTLSSLTDEEKLHLVTSLWAEHLLTVT